MPAYEQISNLNGNILASIDIETTGRLPGYHEIVQIAVVPLGPDIRPLEGVRHFNHLIRPLYPERAEKESMKVSGLSLEELKTAPEPFQVQDWFREWFCDLRLPFQRSLVPLAQNWAFEKGFLTDWLGLEGVSEYFFSHPRDTMIATLFVNDMLAYHGERVASPVVNLKSLCELLGVPLVNAHDALADAVATAEVYRRLLQVFGSRIAMIPSGANTPCIAQPSPESA